MLQGFDPDTGETSYGDIFVNLGIPTSQICNDFVAFFENRQWAVPFWSENFSFESTEQIQTANRASISRLKALIIAVMDQNYDKYKRLAETIGLIYDPIKDWTRHLAEEGSETPSGTEQLRHEVEAHAISFMEASGPVSTISITQDEQTGAYDLGFTFDNERTTDKVFAGGKGTLLGQKIDTVDYKQDGTKTRGNVKLHVSAINGDQNEGRSYTTTYDDSGTGRLQAYTQTDGTTAITDNSILSEELPVIGKARSGNPNESTYTDTKSFTGRTTEKEKTADEEGNRIPIQDLIAKQRDLVKFSLLKEFFDDITKHLLLGTWC